MQARGLACRLSTGLSVAILLLAGCKGRDPSPSDSAVQSVTAEPPKISSAGSQAAHGRSPEEARAARISQLNAELTAMEAEKTQLLQRREAIDAQLASHQEQGQALLASLKTQMQEQAKRGGQDAAFKAQVRAKLEAALAEDTALTTSMSDLDAQVALIDNRIAELSAQLDVVGQQELVLD